MDGEPYCDQQNHGIAEFVRDRPADKVHELIEEVRASKLRRTLEDVQAAVAAWREFSSLLTPSKGAT